MTGVRTTAQLGHPFGVQPTGGLGDALWKWSKSGTRSGEWIRLARRLPGLRPAVAYRFGVVDRPHYAYGVRRATELAARLGLPGVSVVEFGVAGGNGLLALSSHARYYAAETGVAVHVIGFDGGQGLPPPSDIRDVPYLFGEGYYDMDRAQLEPRLGDAQLVLGDVSETVPSFLDSAAEFLRSHPIGFVAFDLDYYSSTMDALTVFRGESHGHLLPRVTCYFDDLPGTVEQIGEAAAIVEFNAAHRDRAIGRVLSLRQFVPFDPPWADQIFVLHQFGHPDYSRLEIGATSAQLPLKIP